MTAAQHRIVQANGVRIHLVEQGTGPLVLLIHGWPELWYSWRHQLPALADAGYRAVAMTSRGYGRSFKPTDWRDYRLSQTVGDVVGVVQALGEKQAVVVGHDWGAPIAWTAAWVRPDLFRGVVGISVPFGGRNFLCLPGDPDGGRNPTEHHRAIAGDDQLFYQEYFSIPGLVEGEAEPDVRGWYRDLVYSASGEALGPMLSGVDLSSDEAIVGLLRQSLLCVPRGGKIRDRFLGSGKMPAWLSEEDLDVFAAEFEGTGFRGGLDYYRAIELSWADLAPMSGKPLEVPAFFIGGEFDVATIWGREAIRRHRERIPQYAGDVVFPGCGHWIQQERSRETNEHLVRFLGDLRGK
ncbi:MAG: hypothetical protein QOD06_1536 [Candidatus Binatota bacterium]|nr:hypothetical protein [Candidatus Binatota bacterium]